MAPEVIEQKYNEKCDVWSCGVIMFILLCGYPPFNGESDKAIIARIKTKRFKFNPEDWDSISWEAKDLIQKMLTYPPANRLSPEEALKHPWFTMINKGTRKIDTSLMKRLTTFSVTLSTSS